jgi:hypothetical protein
LGTVFGTLEVQPEDDHTPSPGRHCFVTGNGSTSPDGDDVDNGKTTLKTALFDLSGVEGAVVSYWRWYADLGAFFSNNDLFTVDITNNNGATWVNAETLDHTKNYWHKVSYQVDDLVAPTGQMKMRFVARDEPDDSLCEACIDDFEIKTYSLPLSMELVGTPKKGTTVHFDLESPEDGGLAYLLTASLNTYPPIPLGDRIFPLAYDFFLLYSLNPSNGIFFNFAGFLDGSGQTSAPTFIIPNLKSLVGAEIFFAAITLDGSNDIKNISAPLMVVIEE